MFNTSVMYIKLYIIMYYNFLYCVDDGMHDGLVRRQEILLLFLLT